MTFYLSKTPRIVQKIFSRLTWCFPSKEKHIYLTFDDGPIPKVTEFVLSELEKYNAKATFFCVGDNIQKHPIVFRQIQKKGHRIANHTFHHINGWKTSTRDYLRNIEKTEKEIEKHHQITEGIKLFRPPYGKIKRSQVTELLQKKYKIIMWDVISGDFDKNLSKEKSLHYLYKNIKNGSIIVFHDSIKAQEKLYFLLPKVLDEFTNRGYSFKTIP
jgi:peptidoglycan/xylan/chitin deacetylase (PgdA/CDA1 family)